MAAVAGSSGNESQGLVPRAQQLDVGLLFGALTRQLAVNEAPRQCQCDRRNPGVEAAHANLSPTRALPLLNQPLVLFNCGASLSQSGRFLSCTILAVHTLAPPPHDQRTTASQLPVLSLRALFILVAPPAARLNFPPHFFSLLSPTTPSTKKLLPPPPEDQEKENTTEKEKQLDSAAIAIACSSHNAKSQPRTRSPHQVLPSRSLTHQHLFLFCPIMESPQCTR